ncbi:hypothetical protein LCGC14_0289510 [marine sediment metagenome]|uniref:Uncharacterized protein n=1 Tax=marine sediment metagenome TaxID=412755 RepID=A0A0F9TYU6_9ZZZZ
MERTVYSEKIPGGKRNFRWPVSFDATGGKVRGHIGIDQYDRESKRLVDRVLLSPAQVTALLEFLGVSR